MSAARVPPSVRQIIWTDYPAFFLTILPVTMWAVVLSFYPRPAFYTAAAVATVVLLALLVWRIQQFLTLFRNGEEAPARITFVSLRGDRGRVEYSYSYRGERFETGAAIHRNAQTRALKAGERVILVLDPRNPRRAFIRSLYQ